MDPPFANKVVVKIPSNNAALNRNACIYFTKERQSGNEKPLLDLSERQDMARVTSLHPPLSHRKSTYLLRGSFSHRRSALITPLLRLNL